MWSTSSSSQYSSHCLKKKHAPHSIKFCVTFLCMRVGVCMCQSGELPEKVSLTKHHHSGLSFSKVLVPTKLTCVWHFFFNLWLYTDNDKNVPAPRKCSKYERTTDTFLKLAILIYQCMHARTHTFHYYITNYHPAAHAVSLGSCFFPGRMFFSIHLVTTSMI